MINEIAAGKDGVSGQIDQCRMLLLQRLLYEINSDPSERGYAGKTASEIAALMNAPILTTVTVDQIHITPGVSFREALNVELSKYTLSGFYAISDLGEVTCENPTMKSFLESVVVTARSNVISETTETVQVSTVVEKPSRWMVLISGVAYAANVITAEEIGAL